MNQKQIRGPNDVLVGHTTICEAARLFSGTVPKVSPAHYKRSGTQYNRPPSILRFLEFCALTEAVVLHDTLFSLPAELPSDVGDLYLRQRLLDARILKEISSPALHEVIPLLGRWLAGGSTPSPTILPTIAQMIDRHWLELHPHREAREIGANDVGVNDLESLYTFERGGWIADWGTGNISEDLFGRDGALTSLGKQIAYRFSDFSISGSYESAQNRSIFRSVIYWQAADRARLPWYPDVLRVPSIVALNQRLESSLTDQVYSIVAKAFSATVDELKERDRPYEAVIPPLGALLLSRCSNREQVIDELFILREEFANFRKTFRELGQRRRSAKSIKDLRDLDSETKNLLKSVASKYDQQDQSIVETILGYAPEVLNPLGNPLDPERYSSQLLRKSYEWIRTWWCRRPASRLFSVTKKLERLDLYGELVPRIFGFEITSEDVDFIKEYSSEMRFLLGSAEPRESKTS